MNILFLSNGHGEDLNASLVVESLQKQYPDLSLAAMPLVGLGNAYKRLGLALLGPTQNLPSGGIIYTSPFNWLKDIAAGLIRLTIQQIQTILAHRHDFNLVVAVGDIVPIAFAYITGKPFVAFIVSTSSYYEGTIRLPLITEYCLRSPRCQKIFTRDKFTAQDLQQKGIKKAVFAGYPIMDILEPQGKNLKLDPNRSMIALLPGSRVPEAINNLGKQLQICEAISEQENYLFCAALVPNITEKNLETLAQQLNWQYLGSGQLLKHHCRVHCHWDAFSDILQQCHLAIGMAGTAVEQAVGLGKPVVQIPGDGPQFTYAFAEAQMRLLGSSVITIGKKSGENTLFLEAANRIVAILSDKNYLALCQQNGLERVGLAGGSAAIAAQIRDLLL
jgi:uncharacterized protein (TIGR03492 family)